MREDTMTTEGSKAGGLYAALAAAQGQMGPALKDSTNPAFKSRYADLASVMAACLPALNANGIAVLQPPVEIDGARYVKTILAHVSGETAECLVPLIVQKNDMQGYGSAVTYARRYGLMAMAGVAPEDDDGNAAVKAAPRPARAPDEVARTDNPTTDALNQAWKDAVLDSLPDNASLADKAAAFSNAIVRDFQGKTGVKALENEWTRRQATIDWLADKFPALHGNILEAYETRRLALTGDATIGQG